MVMKMEMSQKSPAKAPVADSHHRLKTAAVYSFSASHTAAS
jgi:hypothetical protein